MHIHQRQQHDQKNNIVGKKKQHVLYKLFIYFFMFIVVIFAISYFIISFTHFGDQLQLLGSSSSMSSKLQNLRHQKWRIQQQRNQYYFSDSNTNEDDDHRNEKSPEMIPLYPLSPYGPQQHFFSSSPTNGACNYKLQNFSDSLKDFTNPENDAEIGLPLTQKDALPQREICRFSSPTPPPSSSSSSSSSPASFPTINVVVHEIINPYVSSTFNRIEVYENVLLTSIVGDVLPIPCSLDEDKIKVTLSYGQDVKTPSWGKRNKIIEMIMKNASDGGYFVNTNNDQNKEDEFVQLLKNNKQKQNDATLLTELQYRYFDTIDRAVKIYSENSNTMIAAKNDTTATTTATVVTPLEVTLIRINRFDVENVYEDLHSYLNVYLLLVEIFHFDDPSHQIQFVFLDTLGSSKSDDEMWHSFTLNKNTPIYRYQGRDGLENLRRSSETFDSLFKPVTNSQYNDGKNGEIRKNHPVFVARLIDGLSTGSSILRTPINWIKYGFEKVSVRKHKKSFFKDNSHMLPRGAFAALRKQEIIQAGRHGRKKGNEVCSEFQLFAQKSVRWMKENLIKMEMKNDEITNTTSDTASGDLLIRRSVSSRRGHRRSAPKSADNKINVIFSSRSIHKRDGRFYIPTRMMFDEPNFILALNRALGPSVHLTVVDFAKLSRRESIELVENCQVMIALHGASNIFSMFAPASNAALIEIFADDRMHGENAHYEITSRLVDLHYRPVIADDETLGFAPMMEWFGNESEDQNANKREKQIYGFRRGMKWDQDFIAQITERFFSLPWLKKPLRYC